VAIRSFASEAVREVFVRGGTTARVGWSNLVRIVVRKLDMLDYASDLRDLASPPGNRLEALKGNRSGFHSIRVNDQWRLSFAGPNPDPRMLMSSTITEESHEESKNAYHPR
jgi:proteic killer suppression protein